MFKTSLGPIFRVCKYINSHLSLCALIPFYLGYEAFCDRHWVCMALLKFMKKVPETHTHSVSDIHTRVPTGLPQFIVSNGGFHKESPPTRHVRSNGTTSMNSIRDLP